MFDTSCDGDRDDSPEALVATIEGGDDDCLVVVLTLEKGRNVTMGASVDSDPETTRSTQSNRD